MPMEGQWRRTSTPLYKLTRRERLVAIAAAVATVVAIAALVIATAGNTRPAPGPGCIRADVPGVMGSAELDACGQRARKTCAEHVGQDDAGSLAIEASCREARISS